MPVIYRPRRGVRGLGASCASYGSLPAGYTCVDSASGDAMLIPPGGSFSAPQTGSISSTSPPTCADWQNALSFDPSLAALAPAGCVGGGSSSTMIVIGAALAGLALLLALASR